MEIKTATSKHISRNDLILKRHQLLFTYGELAYEKELIHKRAYVIDDTMEQISNDLQAIEELINNLHEENLENT